MDDDKNLFNNIPDDGIADAKPSEVDMVTDMVSTTDVSEDLIDDSGVEDEAAEPTPEPEYGTPEYEAKHNPLGIKEEDIWTYRVEGLAAPHINKPFDNSMRNKIIFIIVILVAISLSCYFSIRAIAKDTFEYTALSDGSYELKEFRNTGFITEITLNYVIEMEYDRQDENSDTNYTLVEQTEKPLTSIREYAFNCDEKLEVISIGANVTHIDGKSFYYCTALRCIYVDDANEYYCDVDGVLYNKDKTEIICYPIDHDEYLRTKYGYAEDVTAADAGYTRDALTYVIPSTVTRVGELCFNYSELKVVYIPEGVTYVGTLGFFRGSLTEIYSYRGDSADGRFTSVEALGDVYDSLPEGLEYIGSDAFSYNEGLTYMFIPASVTHVGHHAFWDCVNKQGGELTGLTEIHVARSEDEFKHDVKTGDQWMPKYDYLLFSKKVPVHYSSERR